MTYIFSSAFTRIPLDFLGAPGSGLYHRSLWQNTVIPRMLADAISFFSFIYISALFICYPWSGSRPQHCLPECLSPSTNDCEDFSASPYRYAGT